MFGFELLEHLALLGDDGFQGFFEVFLGAGAGGGIAAGWGDCAEGEGDGELGVVSRRRRGEGRGEGGVYKCSGRRDETYVDSPQNTGRSSV